MWIFNNNKKRLNKGTSPQGASSASGGSLSAGEKGRGASPAPIAQGASAAIPTSTKKSLSLTKTKKTMTSDTGVSQGVKRSRAATTASGFTPPTKSQCPSETAGRSSPLRSNKTSYAWAAKGALEIVVVDGSHSHITRGKFYSVEKAALDKVIEAFHSGAWLPTINTWSYSTAMATVSFNDDRSRRFVLDILASKGLVALSVEEWKELRQPTKIYSGVIRGATAMLDLDIICQLLARDCRSKNIPGGFSIVNTVKTQTGDLILYVKVREDQIKVLDSISATLSVGVTTVLLQDVRGISRESPSATKVSKETKNLND